MDAILKRTFKVHVAKLRTQERAYIPVLELLRISQVCELVFTAEVEI